MKAFFINDLVHEQGQVMARAKKMKDKEYVEDLIARDRIENESVLNEYLERMK